MKASSILDRVSILLNDPSGTRWPSSQLIDWLNEAAHELVRVRPDANATYTDFLLTANSARQTIPTDGVAAIGLTHNRGADGATSGNAITPVPRIALDALVPAWRTTTGSAVEHFIFDPATPKSFFIYPHLATTWYVELAYGRIPTDIDQPEDDFQLTDEWAAPVVDYVVSRALSKNKTEADGKKAAAHLQLFYNALGAKDGVNQ